MKPSYTSTGLACYRIGLGEPVMVVPYPHAATTVSIAEDAITKTVLDSGRSVITFDPPGAYNSRIDSSVEMHEMIQSIHKTLDHFSISEPIDLLGHSMGSLCALAFALSAPKRILRLVLIGCCSGWKVQNRFGIHKSWRVFERGWWESRIRGALLFLGIGDRYCYITLNNLVQSVSFVDPNKAVYFPVTQEDRGKPLPIRGRWLKQAANYDYANQLSTLSMPVLLCVGRYDRQTPVAMSAELARKIANAQMVIFKHSGHFPHIEELKTQVNILKQFWEYGEVANGISCTCQKECQYHGDCLSCRSRHEKKRKTVYCERNVR